MNASPIEAATSVACLSVLRGDGQELTLPLIEGVQVVVGRDFSCDIVLDDDLVSRQHALLCLCGTELRVRDTSTNGSLAGNLLLRSSAGRLREGEVLRIGCSRMQLWLAPQPASHGTPVLVFEEGSAKQPSGSARVSGDSRHEWIELRREIHRLLLRHLDMNSLDTTRSEDPSLRPQVLESLRRVVQTLDGKLPTGLSRDRLIGEMADEALGLGPLEQLLADPAVSEIMVVDAHHIYVERSGRLELSEARFTDEERVRAVVERIVTPLGRRVDESSPLVDARLADGSRVNVVIRPLALRGSCITIRKFARDPITLGKLLSFGTLSESMARFLTRSVRAHKNIVIAGGTGSGKTTLLNVLSAAIPECERIVTIEDAAELQLSQPHVVSLESRPPNMEGKGEVPIRILVKNALRMRPDRIVVGECRGGEALDMLQAMNTGHDGSLTTTHANSPYEALMRLETLSLMAGVGLPSTAIREQISKSIHLLVQQTRLPGGARKVTAITEMAGLDREGRLRLRPIFQYLPGPGRTGLADGHFAATGYLPSFLPELLQQGLIEPGEPYL